MNTYPGLDITAGVLPFATFRRVGAAAEGGVGCSGSATFCRFVRRGGAFAGSGWGTGLGSRGGALRFRDAGGGREDGGAEAAGTPAEVPEDSEEEAACLADARVILEDMSICLTMKIFNTPRRLCATRWKVARGCGTSKLQMRMVQLIDLQMCVAVDADEEAEAEAETRLGRKEATKQKVNGGGLPRSRNGSGRGQRSCCFWVVIEEFRFALRRCHRSRHERLFVCGGLYRSIVSRNSKSRRRQAGIEEAAVVGCLRGDCRAGQSDDGRRRLARSIQYQSVGAPPLLVHALRQLLNPQLRKLV